jgi:L-amino acid N-acyltransferase YncA
VDGALTRTQDNGCAIRFREEYTRRGPGHLLLQHLIEVLRNSGFFVALAGISDACRFFAQEEFSRAGYLPGVGSKNGQTLDFGDLAVRST